MNKGHAAEAPWLIGVALGILGLWWRGYAFVPLPFLSSYDWMEYVPSAWMVTRRSSWNRTGSAMCQRYRPNRICDAYTGVKPPSCR